MSTGDVDSNSLLGNLTSYLEQRMAEMNPFADQTQLKAQHLTTDGRLPVLTLLQLSQQTD